MKVDLRFEFEYAGTFRYSLQLTRDSECICPRRLRTLRTWPAGSLTSAGFLIMAANLYSKKNRPSRSFGRRKIWRYMDFTKFVALALHDELYFTRLDGLDDKHEGALPYAPLLEMEKTLAELRAAGAGAVVMEGHEAAVDSLRKRWEEIVAEQRRRVCVSCWHLSEFESAAMWKLYGNSRQTVCVQTTVDAFVGALKEDNVVLFGKVRYRNFDNWMIEEDDILDAAYCVLTKRNHFDFEREMRAMVMLNEGVDVPGVGVRVDFKKLVKRVYVDPAAEKWFDALVRDFLYSLKEKIDVRKSSLFEPPSVAKRI